MNTIPLITEIPKHTKLTKNILSHEGLTCSLLVLGPAEEVSPAAEREIPERVLFVVEGEVTVHVDELYFILQKEDALHVPKGKEHSIVAAASGWSKILRVDLPPREIITPQILTLPAR
jgi:mannose-6-phosphate isomerase-like protein (cupin superfamily)